MASERPRVRTRSLALVLTAIVGFTATGVASARESAQPPLPAPTKTLRTLSDYPQPPVTGPQLANGVDAFSGAHPLRVTGSRSQTNATEQLRAELAALG